MMIPVEELLLNTDGLQRDSLGEQRRWGLSGRAEGFRSCLWSWAM